VFVALALVGACSALPSPARRAHGKLALAALLCRLLSPTLYAAAVRDIILLAFLVGIFAGTGIDMSFSELRVVRGRSEPGWHAPMGAILL
jgi:hypothetical protein